MITTMRFVVYESPYLMVLHDDSTMTVRIEWLPASSGMSVETYKQELLNYLAKVEEVRPERILSVMRNFGIQLDEVTRNWSDKTKAAVFDQYISKQAIVDPMESNMEAFNEKVIEELDTSYDIEHFNDEHDALSWLGQV